MIGPYREPAPKPRRVLDVGAFAARALVAAAAAFVEWMPVACVIAACALPDTDPHRRGWIALSLVLVVISWALMSLLRVPYAFRAALWIARRVIDAYQRDVWREP